MKNSAYFSFETEEKDYHFETISYDEINYGDENGDITIAEVRGEKYDGQEAFVCVWFENNRLSAGVYGLDFTQENMYTNLVKKYENMFGKDNASGSGRTEFTLWLDGNDNCVCVINGLGVVYSERDSIIYDLLNMFFGYDGRGIKEKIGLFEN